VNRSAVVLLCLYLIAGVALTVSVLGQTPTPTPTPAPKLAAMSREIREEVDRVASSDAGKRATGALSLGQMGAAATGAILYLVPLLDDASKVYALGKGATEVALIAGEALVEIGPKGTGVLIGQLKRENSAPRYARCTAAKVLGRKKVATAAPVLRAALAHSDVDDIEGLYIVEALAAIGDSDSLASIMTFLSRDSIGLRTDGGMRWQFFQEPLKSLTDQDFETRKDALAWWQKKMGTHKEQK